MDDCKENTSRGADLTIVSHFAAVHLVGGSRLVKGQGHCQSSNVTHVSEELKRKLKMFTAEAQSANTHTHFTKVKLSQRSQKKQPAVSHEDHHIVSKEHDIQSP